MLSGGLDWGLRQGTQVERERRERQGPGPSACCCCLQGMPESRPRTHARPPPIPRFGTCEP